MLVGVEAGQHHPVPVSMKGSAYIVGSDIAPIIEWPGDSIGDLQYVNVLQIRAKLHIWRGWPKVIFINIATKPYLPEKHTLNSHCHHIPLIISSITPQRNRNTILTY